MILTVDVIRTMGVEGIYGEFDCCGGKVRRGAVHSLQGSLVCPNIPSENAVTIKCKGIWKIPLENTLASLGRRSVGEGGREWLYRIAGECGPTVCEVETPIAAVSCHLLVQTHRMIANTRQPIRDGC